jgi:hypothetical protein
LGKIRGVVEFVVVVVVVVVIVVAVPILLPVGGRGRWEEGLGEAVRAVVDFEIGIRHGVFILLPLLP